jgi:hypothetical protein
MVDKKNKLSVGRDNLFNTGGVGSLRVAHNPNDELSIYTLWMRLKGMKHPNQKHVYHYEASAEVREMWKAEGKGNCRMNPLRRMGRHTVGNLLQDLCSKLQIPNSEHLRNHCLRQAGITKMVNDPKVNQLEEGTSLLQRSCPMSGATERVPAICRLRLLAVLSLQGTRNQSQQSRRRSHRSQRRRNLLPIGRPPL